MDAVMKIVGLLLRIGGAVAGVAAVMFIPDAVLTRSIAALGLSGSVDLTMARVAAHGLFGLIGLLIGLQIAAMLGHRPVEAPGSRHDAAEAVPRLRRHLVEGEKKQVSAVPRYEDPNAAPTKPVAVSFKELGLEHPHASEYPDPAGGEHDDHHDAFAYREEAQRPESAGSADDEWAEFGDVPPPVRAQPSPVNTASAGEEPVEAEPVAQWTTPEPFPAEPEAAPVEEPAAAVASPQGWDDAPVSGDLDFEPWPEEAEAEPEWMPEPAVEAVPVEEVYEPAPEPAYETATVEPEPAAPPEPVAEVRPAPEPAPQAVPQSAPQSAPQYATMPEPAPIASMMPAPAPAPTSEPVGDVGPDQYSRVRFAAPSDENWYDGAGDDEEEAEDDGAGYGSLSDIGLGRTHQPRGGEGQRGEALLPPSEFAKTSAPGAIPKGKPQDFRLREALEELMRVDPSNR